MNKHRIYVLEDDPGISDVLQQILTEEGYQVSLYPTISAIKSALRKMTPDLLLLDVKLPDGNGIDLCRELKAHIPTADVPMLLMSANLDTRKRSVQSGDEFIAKPFDIDWIVSSVRSHLNDRSF